MKNLLMTLCAVFGITAMISAQTVSSRCWNFEESCSDPSHSFYLGCIPYASSSHGTPDNYTPNSGQPVPASSGGAHYAHMYTQYFGPCPGTSGDQGEGILLQFNFQAGHTYKISFLARQTGRSDLRAILVNSMPNTETHNVINGCGDEDVIPAVPTDHYDVMTINSNSLSSGSWLSYTQSVTPSTSFNQLWFRPKAVLGNSNAVFIDNVCVDECPTANFEYELCKVENQYVRISAAAPSGTTGEWQLYNAINCNGGTGNNNISFDAVASSTESNPQFLVQYNTGCYILQYTITSSIQGCPNIVIRKIFDSAYGGTNSLNGAFSIKNGCASPTYNVIFAPKYNGPALHHWELHDAVTNQLIQSYTSAGTAALTITVNYGFAYRMDHWATSIGSETCYSSDVHWITFGCGSAQEKVGASGSHPLLNESTAKQYIEEREMSGTVALINSLLYPNPASGESVTLQVGRTTGETYNVALHDIQGHLVQSYLDQTEPRISIATRDLSQGIYFIKVGYTNGGQETLKLVIVK
jgi:hypothetical protein